MDRRRYFHGTGYSRQCSKRCSWSRSETVAAPEQAYNCFGGHCDAGGPVLAALTSSAWRVKASLRKLRLVCYRSTPTAAAIVNPAPSPAYQSRDRLTRRALSTRLGAPAYQRTILSTKESL